MPLLQLTPDDIDPATNRSALHYVASVMLWPSDGAQRRKAEAAALTDEIVRWIDSMDPAAPIPAGDVARMTQLAITALRLCDVRADAKKPLRDGAMAGTILHDFLGWQALGKPAPIDLVKRNVALRFEMSPQHVENRAWKNFRCVAHLWCAWITFIVEYRDKGISGGFPCRFQDLPHFLALAERNRLDGERSEFRQSAKGTILKADETWRVPLEIRLPEIGVETIKKLSKPY